MVSCFNKSLPLSISVATSLQQIIAQSSHKQQGKRNK